MVTGYHGKVTLLNGQEVHCPISFLYANSTARLAATGFTIEDGYKFAIDIDTKQMYYLENWSGPTWANLGNEFSVLAGDVTGNPGSNLIANDAVTFAKIQNVSTDVLLGRDTAASGNVEEIGLGNGLAFSGSQTITTNIDGTSLEYNSGAIRRAALTGDVTATAGSNATTIANDAVTTAKIINDAVTYAKIQNVTTDRLLGRDTAGSGDTEEISLNATLEFTGSTSIQRAAISGDVTIAAGSNSATVTDLTIASEAQGDILYRNATNWVRLAASTDGYVLTTHGAAANPTWAASSGGGLTNGTAIGQMLYWNGSAWVALATGTDGYVLQTRGDGYAPRWYQPTFKQIVFAADGTYTPTTGMRFCKVRIWGGGGAGGTATTAGGSGTCGAGGGGAGGYAEDVFSAAEIGASKAIVIGAGGTSAAVNGAASTFGSTLLVANGGSSAPAGTSTGGTGGGYNLGGAGGTASGTSGHGATVLRTFTGTRGGDGCSVLFSGGAGLTGGIAIGGAGGMSYGGMSNPSRAVGATNSSSDLTQLGSDGIAPGSGGGGSVNYTENSTIGSPDGFRGECIIEEYI